MRQWLWTLSACLIASAPAFSDSAAMLKGKVTDGSGKPIEHAMVMVFHAGVKTGYSTFCPSCYADCGKRTFTDAAGTYSFTNLNPDLWFQLLIAHDGYAPVTVDKVDPASGVPAAAVLRSRSAVDDPRRMVRGRVVDPNGNPLRDVVVEPRGDTEPGGVTNYGELEGMDRLVVSNDKGEFEVNYEKPAFKILLLLESRSMAPRYVALPTGTDLQMIPLSAGAVIRGRLVKDGKGVEDAEVGLFGQVRGGFKLGLTWEGNPFGEMKIGTQKDGTFEIANVPSPEQWYLYGKMESLLGRGANEPVKCATTKNREVINVGDIQVKPGHRLRGRVLLGDGKPMPGGMRILISSDRAWDFQTANLGADGHFEFADLPTGSYTIAPAVKGYALPDGAFEVAISVDRDVEDWSIVLKPLAGAAAPH